MKTIKVFLLFIMLVFLLNSCKESQNESSNVVSESKVEVSKINSEAETSKNESSEVESSVSAPTVLLRETIHKKISGTEKIVFEYDEQNREISRMTYNDDNLTTTIIRGYDKNSYNNYMKISSAVNSNYTEDSWINSPTGNIVSGESKGKSGNETFHNTIKYSYDEKNRLVSVIEKDKEDNVIVDMTYEYLDEYGSHKFTNITYGKKTITINIYDAAGNKIEIQSIDNEGNIISSTKTEYNDKKNIIKTDKNGVVTTHTWEYDGDKIKKHSIYNANKELTSTSDYTYNNDGNLIKIVFYDANGAQTQETQYNYS